MKERGLILTKENRLASIEGRKTQTRRIIVPQPEYTPPPKEYAHHTDEEYWGWSWKKNKKDRFSGVLKSQMISDKGLLYHDRPPYQVGDHLYCREKWFACEVDDIGVQYCVFEDEIVGGIPCPLELRYIGIGGIDKIYQWGWHPSIHMRKEFVRYWFEVTKVRVERVQDISEEDAIAEGVLPNCAAAVYVENIGFVVRPQDLCPACKPFGVCQSMCHREWIRYGLDDELAEPCYSAKDSFETLWDSINKKRGYGWDKNDWVFVYDYEKINGDIRQGCQHTK